MCPEKCISLKMPCVRNSIFKTVHHVAGKSTFLKYCHVSGNLKKEKDEEEEKEEDGHHTWQSYLSIGIGCLLTRRQLTRRLCNTVMFNAQWTASLSPKPVSNQASWTSQ